VPIVHIGGIRLRDLSHDSLHPHFEILDSGDELEDINAEVDQDA
jgi:hypothetical protein